MPLTNAGIAMIVIGTLALIAALALYYVYLNHPEVLHGLCGGPNGKPGGAGAGGDVEGGDGPAPPSARPASSKFPGRVTGGGSGSGSGSGGGGGSSSSSGTGYSSNPLSEGSRGASGRSSMLSPYSSAYAESAEGMGGGAAAAAAAAGMGSGMGGSGRVKGGSGRSGGSGAAAASASTPLDSLAPPEDTLSIRSTSASRSASRAARREEAAAEEEDAPPPAAKASSAQRRGSYSAKRSSKATANPGMYDDWTQEREG